MNDQLELDWLIQARPEPLPLDPDTTVRVRGSLMTHATGAEGRRRRARRWSFALRPGVHGRVPRNAAATLALAGAGAIAVLAIGSGSGGLASHSPAGAGAVATGSPLTRLSVRLADAAAPLGNATLVLRTQTNQTGSSSGAELFADNGNDYWAPTQAGLASVIKGDETVNQGAADPESRDVAAAKAALSEPIGQARQQMSVANLNPGVTQAASKAQLDAALRAKLAALPPAARAKFEQALQHPTQQFLISRQDDMIWNNAMDAVLAAPGDTQVRAGVLKLLATIPQITVTQGTLNGHATLDLTASIEPATATAGVYQEEWILDANTGVPLKFIGGNAGAPPSATEEYTISRVTVSAIEDGSAG